MTYTRLTVAILRQLLADLPDDMPIVVDGYEGDYSTPCVQRERFVLDHQERTYNGEHVNADYWYEEEPPAEVTECLLLSRQDPNPGGTVHGGHSFPREPRLWAREETP